MKTRRDFLKIAVGSFFLADTTSLFDAECKYRTTWKIGICDWDLRASGSSSSFAIAKELGFEGVQVSYQPEGPDSLANKTNRKKFIEAAKESGICFASLCIGLLNDRPLATTPEAIGWVEDCINAMNEMNIDQVLVPFFGNGDLTQHEGHLPLVIEKFKQLAKIAGKNKKILAVESYLSAEEHLKLIDAIGSDAVKVYYDVRNSRNKNYDIFHEIELLGKNKMISQIHFKEDGCILGEGDINFTKVCETLDMIEYDGWIVVESSSSKDWRKSQIANAQFVKKLIN